MLFCSLNNLWGNILNVAFVLKFFLVQALIVFGFIQFNRMHIGRIRYVNPIKIKSLAIFFLILLFLHVIKYVIFNILSVK